MSNNNVEAVRATNPFSRDNSNILQITIVNSQTLSTGTKLKINPRGMVTGSLRNANDGITYFGYIDPEGDDETTVDYVLPPKYVPNGKGGNENNKIEKYSGRYFQIAYNSVLKEYYLRDLGNGLGTFVKIKTQMILKDNSLINIGDSYLVVNFDPPLEKTEGNEEGTIESRYQGIGRKLIVNLYDEKRDNQKKTYSFTPGAKIIRVGRRKHGNDIELEDSLVSKVNSNITYHEKEGWVIRDGNEICSPTGEIISQTSTNGTWFLAIEDFKIYDGLIFKGHFNLFCCNFVKH